MISLIRFPHKKDWRTYTTRPTTEKKQLDELVDKIFNDVLAQGDDAVCRYTSEFDGIDIKHLRVTDDEFFAAEEAVPTELRTAIEAAIQTITMFHSSQIEAKQEVETATGVVCWRENRPIEKVGLYIPGGSAPLFSTVLMLGIPATLAGCNQIVLCSPPDKQGKIHPAILFAAKKIGITTVIKAGGIQAIAALTYGTQSVPAVYKIFGPGNQYVTAAKMHAQQLGIAIDMPAGPSEVLVIADKSAHPAFVAADLLSQAEHGADSQVILLTISEELLEKVASELQQQLLSNPRAAIAMQAIQHSFAILLPTIEDCFEFSNLYAPEHLILACDNPRSYISRIQNAGSVFLGHYSCESLGDYASGTNHTLPTNGYARNYSGVSLDSFVKKITFQEVEPSGLLAIGPHVEVMAAHEQLFAHKEAVTIRLNALRGGE
jgi:histidinol dehydrogenase